MWITLLASNRLPSNAELQTITTDEQVTTPDDAADCTRRCRCCWVTPRATAAATCYGSSCYCCLQPNTSSIYNTSAKIQSTTELWKFCQNNDTYCMQSWASILLSHKNTNYHSLHFLSWAMQYRRGSGNPPPFRIGDPAVSGCHPLVTPLLYTTGLAVFFVCTSFSCLFFVFLQYFDTGGWVFWPVKLTDGRKTRPRPDWALREWAMFHIGGRCSVFLAETSGILSTAGAIGQHLRLMSSRYSLSVAVADSRTEKPLDRESQAVSVLENESPCTTSY